jgi:hypothetical protein
MSKGGDMANDTATIEVAQRADEALGAGPRSRRAHARRWRAFVLLPLLVVAYGCGGGGGGDDSHTGQSTGTAPPDDLVGQWKTTLTYVPAYYTGLVSNSDFIGSLGVTLIFAANGSYRFELDTAATYFGGNCFRTTGWTETGTVDVAEPNITFKSTHAIDVVTDSCGKAKFVDPAPTGAATYTMTREQDPAGRPMLRLRLPTGEDLVLEKT